MAAPKKIDYDRIEPGWRAGLLSPGQLAAEYEKQTGHKVSRAAIIKHFEKAGIARDLSGKIHDRAAAMVTEAMVTGKVAAKPSLPDSTIIEAGSMQVAGVQLSQRTDIRRNRTIVARLMDELEQQVGPENAELLSQLGEIMRSPDENGQDKRNDLYNKIISLPERAKTTKTLAETLRITVDMERQNFGMDAKGADATPGSAGYVPPAVHVHFVQAPVHAEDEADA